MPLCKLQVSVPVPDAKRDALLASLTNILAEAIGKPPRYVMVALAEGAVCLDARPGPAAFADVRSIGGLGGRVNKQISEQICRLLEGELKIPGDRVFLNFTDVPAGSWGYNGSTFG